MSDLSKLTNDMLNNTIQISQLDSIIKQMNEGNEIMIRKLTDLKSQMIEESKKKKDKETQSNKDERQNQNQNRQLKILENNITVMKTRIENLQPVINTLISETTSMFTILNVMEKTLNKLKKNI